jgi:hypothetical protein
MTKAKRDIKRKLRVLDYAQENRNISKTCRYFVISRQTYYECKQAYAEYGEKGLINSKPCSENPTLRVPQGIEKKSSI